MASEKEVYDALIKEGFSMAQAAGIMGNIQNESGFSPEAVGDGGTSFGLVQWHVPGYPFAPGLVTNRPGPDLRRQIGYIKQAAQGIHVGGGTAGEIAGRWASEFERCVGCQPGGAQYNSRVANAERIYAQAKSGNWPSAPGIGPGPGGGGPTPGGGPGQHSGWLAKLDAVLTHSFPLDLLQPVTTFGGSVESSATALTGLAHGLGAIGAAVGRAEHAVEWFFVPSHWVRIFAGIGGAFFLAMGLFNISRTGKPYSMDIPYAGTVPATGGQLAPAVGIAEVTFGAILLFIAFHNLPDSVDSPGALFAHLKDQMTGATSASQSPAQGGQQ